MPRLSPAWFVTAMCGAEILTMLGFSAFAALLPEFRELWSLSNTEAGWISGIFFAGYTLAVPVLVSLTDRVDPKRIYLFSGVVTVAATLGFAFMADGFWSAMLFRFLAGVGLAGTYMPGLKAIGDQIGGSHSRAVAFYTSSFGVGVGLSYVLAGRLAPVIGWEGVFVVAGLAAALGVLIVMAILPWAQPKPAHERPDTALLDFRPVIRNRSTLAFTLCYTVHNWELFALRAWVVAFLVFTEMQHGVVDPLVRAAEIAAVLTILGMPSSIWGNELAIRFGRRRMAAAMMALSALVCFAIGFASALSWLLVVVLCLVHGMTVASESSTVTAGAIGNADQRYRGATMALHSTLGFAGGFVGPLAFGIVLDAFGGETVLAWGIAFAHLGAIMLLGPLVIWWLRPDELPGDRRR